MAQKKQGFYTKYIQPHMGVSIFIAIITFAVGAYLTNEKDKIVREAEKKEIETRIPETVAEFNEIVDHINEVPSDVENYQREQRLIEQGDTLLTYQVEISQNIKVIDSFFQFAKDKKISDSITEVVKQISRDQRGDDIKVLLNNSINQTNAINAINQRLDTIN